MRFVQMPGESKDPSEEEGADLDGGLAHTPGEARGFLQDQHPEPRLRPEKLERGG